MNFVEGQQPQLSRNFLCPKAKHKIHNHLHVSQSTQAQISQKNCPRLPCPPCSPPNNAKSPKLP